MSKLLISASALAICLGCSAGAFAQQDTQTTTKETTTTPEGSTTTRTTTSDDGYTQYRKTVTSTHHYNAGPYEAPQGFSYTRFTVGQRVPHELLIGNDELADYSQYRLVAPPEGLIWIRDGGDALLVDRQSGEVVQADYGLFSS